MKKATDTKPLDSECTKDGSASSSQPEAEKAKERPSAQSYENEGSNRRNRTSRSINSQPAKPGIRGKCKEKFAPFLRCLQTILASLQAVFDNSRKFFSNMFTIPLVHDPVVFCRAEDFTNTGERVKAEKKLIDDEHAMDMLEAACNYSAKTRATLVKMIEDRKQYAVYKENLSKDLDFSKLAPWNESVLFSLTSTFQVFDISGDGVIDLDEMTAILNEFGDKSSPEDRQKVFKSADVSRRGVLTFKEFVTMIHRATVKAPNSVPSTIADTFKQIERNMSRIRSLDVVQQLQAGLF